MRTASWLRSILIGAKYVDCALRYHTRGRGWSVEIFPENGRRSFYEQTVDSKNSYTALAGLERLAPFHQFREIHSLLEPIFGFGAFAFPAGARRPAARQGSFQEAWVLLNKFLKRGRIGCLDLLQLAP
jgi:hypothetical protein